MGSSRSYVLLCSYVAEREGFEPSNRFKPVTAFPVLLLRPLGHLSGVCDAMREPGNHMDGRTLLKGSKEG